MFEQASGGDVDETKSSDMVALGAAASVVLALYEFYINGNSERGVFIGLWPPTILAFATYLRDRME